MGTFIDFLFQTGSAQKSKSSEDVILLIFIGVVNLMYFPQWCLHKITPTVDYNLNTQLYEPTKHNSIKVHKPMNKKTLLLKTLGLVWLTAQCPLPACMPAVDHN